MCVFIILFWWDDNWKWISKLKPATVQGMDWPRRCKRVSDLRKYLLRRTALPRSTSGPTCPSVLGEGEPLDCHAESLLGPKTKQNKTKQNETKVYKTQQNTTKHNKTQKKNNLKLNF